MLLLAFQKETQARIPQYPSSASDLRQTEISERLQGVQVLQLYGALLLPIILSVGVGLNLVVWTSAHINIPLVFYFDTRTTTDYRCFQEIPALFFCTLCYCFWLSFNVVSKTISPQVWPVVWIFSTILILFNPLPVFHETARWWIIRSTARVITSGLVRVEVSREIQIHGTS